MTDGATHDTRTSWRRRALRTGAIMSLAVSLLFVGHRPVLRGVASFLVVDDGLQRATAIVVLGGQLPFREMEAARLYRGGWAPRVVIVPVKPSEESRALRQLGIVVPDGAELSTRVLIELGVPASAILVAAGEARGTLEELRIAADAVDPGDSAVILVTSKYHGRRVDLTWRSVTRGRPPGIVRSAPQDPFDPQRWWTESRYILHVVREYLGLLDYAFGFPIAGT